LDLLLNQPQPIPSHALVALACVLLGGFQFVSAKGTPQHRWLGRLWVCAMTYVALSSLFIHDIKFWGLFSPIHLLSLWTLFSLAYATHLARSGRIKQHRIWMIALYGLALIVTGVFTLWPGRLMHDLLF